MTHLLEGDPPHAAVVGRHDARTTVCTVIYQRRKRPKTGAVAGY
jgi:hypothetical protein